MDFIGTVLSLLLFVAFVPGVLFTLPSRSSPRNTVLLVHALAFAVATTVVMRFYWVNIKGYVETMTTFGATCPNGFVEGKSASGINQAECVPVGHATYPAGATPKSKTE